MIKIFTTDMDHTLLDDDSNLPKNFQETLNKLKDREIPLVLASGRSLASMKEKVRDIDYNFTFISDNGAIIERNGQIAHKSTISQPKYQQIIDILSQCKETSICVTAIDNSYIQVGRADHIDFLKEYYPEFQIVNDIKSLDEEIIKVTTLNLEDNELIYDIVIDPQINNLDELVALKSGKVWIDIMSSNADKGKALKHLLEILDIAPSNLATFGDYHNDIGMLKLAEYSYAVENAHPDVKQVAKTIIESNNNSPVTRVINEYLQKKPV